MIAQTADSKWGGWVLGDLANALSRASRAAGHCVEVVGVQVSPPQSADRLPEVTITVREQDALSLLYDEVVAGVNEVRFVEEPTDEGWVVELDGLRLTAVLEEGEPR